MRQAIITQAADYAKPLVLRKAKRSGMALATLLFITIFLWTQPQAKAIVVTNAPGTGTSVTNGGALSWSVPGNITLPDGTNATSESLAGSDITHYLRASSFGFDFPGGASILGITVRTRRGASNDSGKWWIDDEIRLVKAGGVSMATNKADATTRWPSTADDAVYGATNDLWGETWSASDVTNSGFGVVVSVGRQGPGGGTAAAYVDFVEISVSYKILTPTLTVFSVHGTPTPSGVTTNGYNALVNASVSGETLGTTQYVATGWAGTGSVSDGSGSNTSFNITNDSTITWQWETKYWLDTAVDGSGAVDTAGYWVTDGSNVAITAIPSNGHNFVGWTGDIVTNINPLVFAMDRPYTVTAGFAVRRYDIVATAMVNGAVTPLGTVDVAHGDDTNFVVAADQYYHIAEIRTNGELVAYSYGNAFTNTVFTWSNVTATGTLRAAFSENLWVNNTPESWLDSYYPGTNDYDSAALSDTDGDGLFAWEEYIVGSDPTDRASALIVTDAGTVNGSNYVKWLSYTNLSGAFCRIDRCTDLCSATWETVRHNVAATPPTNTCWEVDPCPGTAVFYRIVVTNTP